MELTELSNRPIEIKYTESTVTITTKTSLIDNKHRFLSQKKIKNPSKVEILLFDEEEITELQSIAQQIYRTKRQEREQRRIRNESNKKKTIKAQLINIAEGIMRPFK